MKVHTSHHEEDLNWINIHAKLPLPFTKVSIAYIRIIDWCIEELIWESEGWITKGGNWNVKLKSLKVYDNIEFNLCNNNKPTHWKEIKDNN